MEQHERDAIVLAVDFVIDLNAVHERQARFDARRVVGLWPR
jgi:hypothetical protein